MRKLSELTKEEIDAIAKISGDDIRGWQDIEYRAFGKSRSIYSGYTVVRIYQYLASVGVNIFLN